MIAITDEVQNQADDSTVQPATRSSVNAAGARLRRRLSRIFQRDKPGEWIVLTRPPGPGTRGSSHRAICQSPRIQRRRRLTSAL